MSWNASSVGVGMTQADGMSDMAAPVNSGLQQQVWESELAFERVAYDPMLVNTAKLTRTIEVMDQPYNIPMDAVVTDLTPKNLGARKVTQAFKKALSGTGIHDGDTSMITNGSEQIAVKYLHAYSNDWAHSVATQNYGIRFRELSPYQIYQTVKTDLATWNGEKAGWYMREAFCESISHNISAVPLSVSVGINPNFHVVGLAAASQPSSYASIVTGSDMADAVGTACAAVTAANCRLSVPRILAGEKRMRITKYITPLKFMNTTGYILFAHPDEIEYLRDPSQATVYSYAYTWLQGAALNDAQKLLPGLKMTIGNVLVVEDPRCPAMVVGGTASSGYTTTFYYMKMGRTDDRTSASNTSNTCFNANILCGANGLVYFEGEAPHFENQLDEFRKFENIGYIGSEGWCLTSYNVDTNNDSTPTVQHEGSCIWLTQRQ